MVLKPDNYDYLWTDHEINFIFTSCYLFPEFRRADIVLIYNWRDKGLRFFLSKKDRLKFANYGVRFYRHYFPAWQKNILENIKRGKDLIRETGADRLKVARLSERELKGKIRRRARLFQALGGNYFYTEFFFLDKVERSFSDPQIRKNFQAMGRLKFRAREVLNSFYNYHHIFEPYIDEAGRRLKRKDIQWLSYQEVVDLLAGRRVREGHRDSRSWLLAKNTGWQLRSGRNIDKMIAEFERYFFPPNKATFWPAVIANRGSYNGRVKIIRTLFSNKILGELKKVKRGDILVAETTGPEMMVACRRAGAIITDEGGLTSHAAIVARELGVPCLVGAKVATKALQDGDLVRVDADKGLFKILKKAKR